MFNKPLSKLAPEAVTELNNLIQYLHDSYNGYHESCDNIKDTFLKEKFVKAAQNRQSMINEIKPLIIEENTKPAESGTIAGATHRIFLDLKSLITGGDKDAILNEVNRGENVLIEQYQKALLATTNNLEINTILKNQLSKVQADLTTWDILNNDKPIG